MDQNLTSGHDISMSHGKNILGKVLHDTLENLNTYNTCTQVAFAMPQTPNNIRLWLSTHSVVIGDCIERLKSIEGNLREPVEMRDWFELILEVGDVLRDAPLSKFNDIDLSTLADEKKVAHLVKTATNTFRRLHAIYQDICAKDYERLWENNYKDMG